MSAPTLGQPIVIDIGSGTIRAGIAGNDKPSIVFPAVLGRPKRSLAPEASFFGQEAWNLRRSLAIERPIEFGLIGNLASFRQLLEHTFDLLSATPSEHPVLLACTSLTSELKREALVKTLLSELKCPACHLSNREALTLYDAGLSSGLVVNVGQDGTIIIPLHDEQPQTSESCRLGMGDRTINTHFQMLLVERGYNFNTSKEIDILEDVKSKACYVALNFEAEQTAINKSPHDFEMGIDLPDGQVITVGTERFQSPEVLFQPFLAGLDTQGIHTHIFDCISQCDEKIRPALCKNIVLSDDATLYEGIDKRLQRELSALMPSLVINVLAPLNRSYSAWAGGAKMATLPGFSSKWTTS